MIAKDLDDNSSTLFRTTGRPSAPIEYWVEYEWPENSSLHVRIQVAGIECHGYGYFKRDSWIGCKNAILQAQAACLRTLAINYPHALADALNGVI